MVHAVRRGQTENELAQCRATPLSKTTEKLASKAVKKKGDFLQREAAFAEQVPQPTQNTVHHFGLRGVRDVLPCFWWVGAAASEDRGGAAGGGRRG